MCGCYTSRSRVVITLCHKRIAHLMRLKTIGVLLGVLALPALLVACDGDDDDVAGVPAPGDETATQPGQQQASPSPSGDEDIQELTVDLKNWAIEASDSKVEAGTIRFVAKHTMEGHGDHDADEGGMVHQLVVAPLDEGAEVGESKFGAPVVNLTDIEMGEEKTIDVELEPGRYEMACLVVEDVDGEKINHYEKGMYALLEVE